MTPVSRLLVPSLLLALLGCAGMHSATVKNLRLNGEHAKADCYETCEPKDLMCMKQCDTDHPRPLMTDQQREMLQTATELAAANETAKASSQPSTTDTGSASPSPSSVSSSSSSSSSEQRTLTINGTEYTGGEHLGKPCSLESPCPDGYKCHLVTNSSGQCVQ